MGWIFGPGQPDTGPPLDVELLCVPVITTEDAEHKPLFGMLADQRQDCARLAAEGQLDELTVIQAPLREYRPSPPAAGEELKKSVAPTALLRLPRTRNSALRVDTTATTFRLAPSTLHR